MKNVAPGLLFVALFVASIGSACVDELSAQEVDAWIDQVKAEGCGTGGGGQGGDDAITPPECTPETASTDCDGPPDAVCGNAICIDGKCALDIKTGPIASQKYGDCKVTRCNQLGELETIDDADDFYNDANQCTIDFCKGDPPNGVIAINLEYPDGVQCPESGDGYCFQGKCVECIDILPQAACKVPGEVCDGTICEPFVPQCTGGCGGICAPCTAGFPCATAADCQSGVCKNNVCQTPTCDDGVKNDGESGIDCGAPSCSPCPANQGCFDHAQCESNVCMLGLCQAPTCFDAEQNGDEAGVDCGGAKCAPCLTEP